MVKEKYRSWKHAYKKKKDYYTYHRSPFYELAAKYLPPMKNANIVDIGAGTGFFIDILHLTDKYENIFLLDGNKEIIETLKRKFKNAILYKAPKKLPFENSSISFIHCSHLIEHLYYQELYQFFKEIDRVLVKNGILVISTPLLWDKFYDDPDHMKPYNPKVFMSKFWFCKDNDSTLAMSDRYSVLELEYRYKTSIDLDEGWGSTSRSVDFLLWLTKLILRKLGIRKYVKNGYTMVLEKN